MNIFERLDVEVSSLFQLQYFKDNNGGFHTSKEKEYRNIHEEKPQRKCGDSVNEKQSKEYL